MKPRRLVNFHSTGRFAGIAHIHGVEGGNVPLTDAEMPQSVEVLLLDGRYRLTERVGSTERAVFYREVVSAEDHRKMEMVKGLIERAGAKA